MCSSITKQYKVIQTSLRAKISLFSACEAASSKMQPIRSLTNSQEYASFAEPNKNSILMKSEAIGKSGFIFIYIYAKFCRCFGNVFENMRKFETDSALFVVFDRSHLK